MEIKHLKTFERVALLLNFNQAAKALNCSQSTVSAQIKLLEDNLGVLLFDRLGKKILLTEAGSKLIRYARKMMEIEKEIFSEITQNNEPVGHISIRAPQTVGTYLIPEVLEHFVRLYPRVSFNVETCSVTSLKNELRSGIVDLAFLFADHAEAKGFQTEVLKIEPLVLVARPNHLLTMKKTIQIQDLNEETIILPKHDCGYKMVFEKILSEANIKTASKMEFNSVEAVKQCVIKGFGITIIPQLSVREEIKEGKLATLPLQDEILETSLIMIWHKKKWLSPALTAFMNCVRKTLSLL
ncbi:MAG: LysR family transcriptional regulator [Proteobacteria bacterium]|nr:LysR family transcriptional regulator [Pseudomonadota bacterium]MBU1583322.1 LysR family transcriptional regulator [Pseudomonadota bacterium]MBU2454598.1 LysR family transcriptional regulator [Pseudomonadota bacterium]MBU2630305.1 LysR family transcriptional regulator [Pseudomonadota bacterium]